MQIDRLIDSWSDPLLSLYKREVHILMRGIVFIPQSAGFNFSDLMRRIYSLIISQRRNNLMIQSGYTNFSIFADEDLEVKIGHLNGKNIETSIVNLDSNNKNIVNLHNLYKTKYNLEDKDTMVKVTLLEKGKSRLRFEKMIFKSSPEKVAEIVLKRINSFISRVPPDSEFMEFYNSLLGKKDLLSLEIIDNRISLDDDEGLILNHFMVEKTKELSKKSLSDFKMKSDYLDMFEESLKSEMCQIF